LNNHIAQFYVHLNKYNTKLGIFMLLWSSFYMGCRDSFIASDVLLVMLHIVCLLTVSGHSR